MEPGQGLLVDSGMEFDLMRWSGICAGIYMPSHHLGEVE